MPRRYALLRTVGPMTGPMQNRARPRAPGALRAAPFGPHPWPLFLAALRNGCGMRGPMPAPARSPLRLRRCGGGLRGSRPGCGPRPGPLRGPARVPWLSRGVPARRGGCGGPPGARAAARAGPGPGGLGSPGPAAPGPVVLGRALRGAAGFLRSPLACSVPGRGPAGPAPGPPCLAPAGGPGCLRPRPSSCPGAAGAAAPPGFSRRPRAWDTHNFPEKVYNVPTKGEFLHEYEL